MKSRIEVQKALEGIIGSEAANFDSIGDDTDFALRTDEIFLEHVLEQSGVGLSDHTNRTLTQELAYWDREHLADLAMNINFYTKNSDEREKLAYLISHSIRGDLVESLASGNQNDKFAAYNAYVLSHLKKMGVSVEAWLNHGGNLKHAPSLNPSRPFYLETSQWKRDFRSEFAIGDISKCCIAVGGKPSDEKFRHILLDYFLDLSVQVLHVRKVEEDREEEKIGQVYFVAMQSNGKHKSKSEATSETKACLGVTSVELNPAYRGDIDIVPPIANSILSRDGYQEIYGFSSTFIGNRFSAFRGYLSKRKADISNMVSSVLKQRRQNYNHERKIALRQGLPTTSLQEKVETITHEIGSLVEVRDEIYYPSKIRIEKAGLRESANQGGYKGTDYLDFFDKRLPSFSISFPFISDGFFRQAAPPATADGYLIYDKALFDNLEATMNAIRVKYASRRRSNNHSGKYQ